MMKIVQRLRHTLRTFRPPSSRPSHEQAGSGDAASGERAPGGDPDLLQACSCGAPVDRFLGGPRGGSAQNCQCPDCGRWYNLGWLPGLEYPLCLEDQGFRKDLDLRPPGQQSNAKH